MTEDSDTGINCLSIAGIITDAVMGRSMETELVIFDMDGTMADTAPGILSSFMAVPSELGIPKPPVEAYYSYMGGPLVDNMASIYGIDRITAVRAAEIFRKHYESVGFLNAVLYPGMKDLIRSLYGRGVKLGVATMKLDEYAKQLMVRWGIDDMFTEVVGADSMSTVRKTDMIDRCVHAAGTVPKKTIMVGDTANDYRAAMESGIGFVAVTYGYGFSSEVCAKNGIPYAETVGDLERFLREHADVSVEQ